MQADRVLRGSMHPNARALQGGMTLDIVLAIACISSCVLSLHGDAWQAV
jgi:hypothetical protein